MKTVFLAFVSSLTITVTTVRADSYNISLLGGGSFNFVSNELTNSPTGYYVSNLLSRLPPFDSVLKFDVAHQYFYAAQPSETLNPGEGFLVMHMDNNTLLSFSGTQATAQPPLALNPGQYRLVGRRAGGLGPSTYEDLVGASPLEGSTLLLFNPSIQDYIYYSYHAGQWNGPSGSSTPPVVPKGASALVVLQPALTLTNGSGNQIILRWTAPSQWTLEQGTDLAGPWTTVTNAVSPHTVVPAQDKLFFRLHGGLNPMPDIIGF